MRYTSLYPASGESTPAIGLPKGNADSTAAGVFRALPVPGLPSLRLAEEDVRQTVSSKVEPEYPAFAR